MMMRNSQKLLAALLVAGYFGTLCVPGYAEASNNTQGYKVEDNQQQNAQQGEAQKKKQTEQPSQQAQQQDNKKNEQSRDKNQGQSQPNKQAVNNEQSQDKNKEQEPKQNNRANEENKQPQNNNQGQNAGQNQIRKTSQNDNNKNVSQKYLDKQKTYMKETRVSIKEKNIKLPKDHWAYGNKLPDDVREKYERERGNGKDDDNLLLQIILAAVLVDAL